MYEPNLTGYWLARAVRVVGAAADATLRAHCSELGKPYIVTLPQWVLLSTLAANAMCTVTQLGQILAVETPAITGLVTRLERNGLVERVHDLDDRRVVNVSITDEGEHFVRAMDPVITQLNDRLVPPEESLELIAQLKQLITRAVELVPEKAGLALTDQSDALAFQNIGD
jgi:DNA-binding MarR family transcriptional regulator